MNADATVYVTVQKRHALRAYAQALQVYKGRGWSLAEVSSSVNNIN